MLKYFFPFLILTGCVHYAVAQDYMKYKPGEADTADMKMIEYAADSGAIAVILYEYHETNINREASKEYDYVRIKILKASALSLATVKINYLNNDQALKNISAQVTNLNPDGTMSIQKMDKKNILDKIVDGELNEVWFSIPGVKVGSIIEYGYQTVNRGGDFGPLLIMQGLVPVREGDIYFVAPEEYIMNTIWDGDCGNNKVETLSSRLGKSSDQRLPPSGFTMKHVHINDLPAFPDEPYSGNAPDDFKCRYGFVLAANSIANEIFYKIPGWHEVDSILVNAFSEAGAYKSGRSLEQKADQLVARISDPVKKIKAIYTFVRDSFTWNNEYRFYPSDKLKDIFDTKTGNSADINLVLTMMLRRTGFQTYPVLTNTADYGTINTSFAIPEQFNDLVCMVKIDTSRYFLDATANDNPFCFMKWDLLNRRGFVMDTSQSVFVRLRSTGKNQSAAVVRAHISDDGKISGTASLYDQGYFAIDRRTALKDYNKQIFLESYDLNDPSIEIDSLILVKQHDPDANLSATINFSETGNATVSGKKIYLDPVIFPFFKENPFKNETRHLPVDFSYARKYAYQCTFTLPEGYSIIETPENKIVKWPDGSAGITRIFDSGEQSFSISYILTLDRSFYSVSEYDAIRQFFDSYVSMSQEQVVLEKK